MQKLDLFGSIVGLTYKGQSRYKSSFGGISFLIALVLCFSTIVFFFQKFISRDSPKMILDEEKYWNPPTIDLSAFKFIIMMKFNGRNSFNTSIVKVKPLLTRVEQAIGSFTETELKQIPCNERMFPGAEEQYQSLGLDKGICVDTTNITILGSSVNDVFQYITIRFMLCLNNDGCIQSDQLEQFIEDKKPMASVYLYDSAFQPSKRDLFITNYFNNLEVDLTYDDTKYSDIYLSKNELIIEEGIFLSSSKNIMSSIMYENHSNNNSQRAPDQNIALDINLKSYKRKQITNITYMQLSELLANIGAITSNLILVFTFIVEKINIILFQKEIVDELLNSEKTGVATNINSSGPDKSIHAKIGSIINHKSSINPLQQGHRLSLTHGLGELSKKVKQEKLPICKFVLYSLPICCYKKSPEFLALKKLKENLQNKQDLLSLIFRFQDLELLKYLTLTDEQLGIFDLLKRPSIALEQDNVVYLNNFSKYCLKNKSQIKQVNIDKMLSMIKLKN
jgi:hypothetical protein